MKCKYLNLLLWKHNTRAIFVFFAIKGSFHDAHQKIPIDWVLTDPRVFIVWINPN